MNAFDCALSPGEQLGAGVPGSKAVTRTLGPAPPGISPAVEVVRRGGVELRGARKQLAGVMTVRSAPRKSVVLFPVPATGLRKRHVFRCFLCAFNALM